MAIRRKDKEKYLAQLQEVKGLTYFGYSDKVISAARNIGMEVEPIKIYRVVAGQVKDWNLLKLIHHVVSQDI
jgi:hypothetical protein